MTDPRIEERFNANLIKSRRPGYRNSLWFHRGKTEVGHESLYVKLRFCYSYFLPQAKMTNMQTCPSCKFVGLHEQANCMINIKTYDIEFSFSHTISIELITNMESRIKLKTFRFFSNANLFK